MVHRSAVRSGGALFTGAFLAVLLAAGCGDGDPEGGGSSSPSAPATSPSAGGPVDAGARAGAGGARAALQAFLRGQAAGDPAVCRYVEPGGEFLKGPALQGDCALGVRNTPHLLRPAERQALRTVVVTGGRLTGQDAVIPFSALQWTSGSMTVKTLQEAYTLRRSPGGVWRIVH